MTSEVYHAQVDLLIRLLPSINTEPAFALKGGTAMNLFVREMPRLSVDIDLTYVLFDDRETAFRNISEALGRIRTNLEKQINGIKISQISQNGQDQFHKFSALSVVSHGELFGGKICAALDRQHPRDLFDVRYLLDAQGISDTYVLTNNFAKEIILGYFTLSLSAILATQFSLKTIKKLPKYRSYGTILLGRMGRDYHYTPKGFGQIIMRAALLESLTRGTFYAIEVLAKNQSLVKSYQTFGFESLSNNSRHLYLPCATIKAASSLSIIA